MDDGVGVAEEAAEGVAKAGGDETIGANSRSWAIAGAASDAIEQSEITTWRNETNLDMRSSSVISRFARLRAGRCLTETRSGGNRDAVILTWV